MKTLYLIGNGFDIQHKLPTYYRDFRAFLSEHHEEFLRRFEEIYNIYPLDESEPWYTPQAGEEWLQRVNKGLWKCFEEDIGHPNTDEMIQLSECASEGLNAKYGQVLTESTMDAYWHRQYGFVKELQEYVKEWIMSLDFSSVVPCKKAIVNNKSDYFLTFNYTNTLEEVYHIPKEHVLHIHGGIFPYCSTKPIIGHGNKKEIEKFRKLAVESRKSGNGDEASIHNAVANYLQSTLKDTRQIIKDNNDYFTQLKQIRHVVAIGLSFGEVDIPYLLKIKTSVRKDAIWEAFYFGDEAGHIAKVLESLRFKNVDEIVKPTTEFWD